MSAKPGSEKSVIAYASKGDANATSAVVRSATRGDTARRRSVSNTTAHVAPIRRASARFIERTGSAPTARATSRSGAITNDVPIP